MNRKTKVDDLLLSPVHARASAPLVLFVVIALSILITKIITARVQEQEDHSQAKQAIFEAIIKSEKARNDRILKGEEKDMLPKLTTDGNSVVNSDSLTTPAIEDIMRAEKR